MTPLLLTKVMRLHLHKSDCKTSQGQIVLLIISESTRAETFAQVKSWELQTQSKIYGIFWCKPVKYFQISKIVMQIRKRPRKKLQTSHQQGKFVKKMRVLTKTGYLLFIEKEQSQRQRVKLRELVFID